MISTARKSATSNAFIIFDFYDKLTNIVTDHKLKRGNAYRVTCGAGRDNTTVLAVASASGSVLDPLIVFSGKHLQSTWRDEKALPGSWYGISDSGWMTTDVFSNWIEKSANLVTERPLLLLYDGHLTHVSVAFIELAMKQNIIILKFPSHVADVQQPLDVACYAPLKKIW